MKLKYRLSISIFFLLVFSLGGFYFPLSPDYKKLSTHQVQDKHFALVVYCKNNSDVCDKMIHSIKKQNYQNYRVVCIDDGSTDRTYSKIIDSLEQSPVAKKFTVKRYDKTLGSVERLYQSVQDCDDDEIVLFFQGNGWLSHCDVLSEFNDLYKNYDIWLAFGQDCDERTKSLGKTRYVTSQNLFSNSMRRKYWQPPKIKSFYAKLFKKVKISDFFFRGEFVDEHFDSAYMFPMMEMAKDRVGYISNPIYSYLQKDLYESKRPCNRSPRKCHLQVTQTPPYSSLENLDSPDNISKRVDLIIFSYDRPLQLYALLESVDRYAKGLNRTYIIYRASEKKYEEAFTKLRESFPQAEWIHQHSRKDFHPLVLDTIEKASPYLLFGVDDLVVKDHVDFIPILKTFEETQAYFFSLRLGSHIQYCYMGDFATNVPYHINIGKDVLAWQVDAGCGDWTYPNSLDFTLYRKKDIFSLLKKISFQHPNSLEIGWNRAYPKSEKKHAVGLCYHRSKAVNIPLNQVYLSENRSSNYLSKDELLNKFEKGYKMDIGPLYHMQNPSVHIDYYPTFILRKNHQKEEITH